MICPFDSPPTMHAAAADGLLNVILCSFMSWTSDSANDPGSCLYLAVYFAAFSITVLSALLCGLFSSSAPTQYAEKIGAQGLMLSSVLTRGLLMFSPR